MTEFESATIAALPLCVREQVADVARDFSALAAAYPRARQHPLWDDFIRAAPQVWCGSEFVAASCRQHPALWDELIISGDLTRAYARGELRARLLTAPMVEVEQCKQLLRHWRQRELGRIAWRDLAGRADLDEVIATLSEFADTCVTAALPVVQAALVARHGTPRNVAGAAQQLIVLALGKLGGEELNFSSDIDLVLAYADDGETDGAQPLSNHEFFLRVARDLVSVLSAPTGDGFVFRVDLRLRPNGNSGALALSFDAMEQYYQTHGREWERYAWIKARAIAGDIAAGEQLLLRLRPFVYRKYIDYGALAAIRSLKDSIERELARKGEAENVKTGRGGIREIEFIGQAFQLIRGGREPALQVRAIQSVLRLLAQKNYLSAAAVDDLIVAYRFLRNTEHRLQMLRDRQTHNLPHDECERARLAYAMGYDDWPAFSAMLRHHTDNVHAEFERVFAASQADVQTASDAQHALWAVDDETTQRQALQRAGYRGVQIDSACDLLRGLRDGNAYQGFSSHGRERADVLMPLLIAAAGSTATPAATLQRLVKLIEAIGRRSAYFALLIENPMALTQLVKLCAASAWIADWLSLHPVLLDELLNPTTLYTPLSRAALERELKERLKDIDADDLGAQMEALREFRHGHVLRVAAAEIGPGLAPEAARHYLCDIAETIIAHCLEIARHDLESRHGRPRCAQNTIGFAVIAYGKLGSYELGYASDLDIIFLHGACPDGGMTDGARPIANEQFFARLGQRLIHLLATRTAAGFLYQVDMRLRPSGQAGPLVTNLTAFEDYQQKEAWVWEHQALVRARAVGGDTPIAHAFAAIRTRVLCQVRDPAMLAQSVFDMRTRMQTAQTAHDPALFDLKLDRGGIVDIEFMVQYWVLRWAAEHPQLVGDTENTLIIERLRTAGIIAAPMAEVLIAAYQRYLSIEQRLKLMEHRPLVPHSELGETPAQVLEIWQQVFNAR